MGKKTPSAPAAPDPTATAAAQAAANKETAVAQAQLNMVNQYTPQGSLEYTERGKTADGTPQYSATQTFSPEQQALYDLTNQAAQKYGQTANTQLNSVSNTLSQPLDFSSLGAAPTADAAYRQSVEDSMLQRLQPQQDRDRQALLTRLANSGITDPNSEAYKGEFNIFNQSVNDARLAADTQAGNQMAQLYGLQSGQRNQAINEMVQQRQIPLNELAAMLSGSQVQSPNFASTPQTQVAQTPLADSVYGSYNGQMQGYNAGLQNQAANTQGLYSLLGTGAMAGAMTYGGPKWTWSDRRLKTDIEEIGVLPNGLKLYEFTYAWGGRHIGVMADEVREKFPHAITKLGKFDMVDYAMLEAA